MKDLILVLMLVVFTISGFSQSKTGCQSGNCENGKGVYIFNTGDKYEGEFVNSHLNGFGKYTDVNGNVYTGDFKDDKFSGKGMFVRSDGTKYIGEFLNGKRSGLGTQWYSQTYKEKGKWENDRFIENAEFEDFVISESYDFCTEFNKILSASVNSFAEIKGIPVSEYITDSYLCKVKLKELSTVEINDKEGYSGSFFKGNKVEGLKKFEELNKIILKCVEKSCCTYKNTLVNGVTEKKYQFSPVTYISSCNSKIMTVKIEVVCKIQGTESDVILHITNPQ
ncbi:MAG: hypothetical protein HY951_12080 [Bacteroidia bacterium]|nr:hypothetical protein [Bacteroidia bacterium]